MSSNSRRDARGRAGLALAVLAAGLALAAPAPARRARPSGEAARPPAPVADDSTGVAQSMLYEMRAVYGGDDSWSEMDGIRYAITYTIPGPGGAPVRSWTESHYVWLHGATRLRIDTDEDSSVVVVTGDTTRVRRGGAWTDDAAAVAAARGQALDTWWFWHLPRNLMNNAIRTRLLQEPARDRPFTMRFFFEHAGLGRPVGTRLDVTFTPPVFAMRTLHWYDPRAKAWFLLELADDRRRYDWTWAERRTLRASNEAGEPGPVVWTAVVTDMQIEGRMPAIVLAPPDAGPGVVAPADSTAR